MSQSHLSTSQKENKNLKKEQPHIVFMSTGTAEREPVRKKTSLSQDKCPVLDSSSLTGAPKEGADRYHTKPFPHIAQEKRPSRLKFVVC